MAVHVSKFELIWCRAWSLTLFSDMIHAIEEKVYLQVLLEKRSIKLLFVTHR